MLIAELNTCAYIDERLLYDLKYKMWLAWFLWNIGTNCHRKVIQFDKYVSMVLSEVVFNWAGYPGGQYWDYYTGTDIILFKPLQLMLPWNL